MTRTSRQANINKFPGFNGEAGTITYMITGQDGQENPIYGEIDTKQGGTLRCMYCIKTFPIEENVGIPVSVGLDGVYLVEDAFCSLRCCLAELNIRVNRTDLEMNYSNSLNLLREMCKNSGIDLDTVRPAPCRRLLFIMNGPLSYEQFSEDLYYVIENKPPTISIFSKYDFFLN